MQGPYVVVIDDDLAVRQLIGDILEAEGARVALAKSGEEGIALLRREPADVLFVDLRLPGRDGIATIEEVRRFLPQLPIAVITGYGSFESSVEALRLGVADYLTKPITAKKISLALARAISAGRRVKEPVERPAQRAQPANGVAPIHVIAASPEMRNVVDLAQRLAQVSVPALIEGSTGVGKEMIARVIHSRSDRAARPFVRMTCASLREDQLEPLLFGQGGPQGTTPGLLDHANGGTLFLHSVSELPGWFQGQLLEVFQQGWFTRRASDERVELDVRVIASTSVHLPDAIARGEFMRGLYYHLNIVPIVIPPLRERRDDIRALVDHFLEEMAPLRGGRQPMQRAKLSKDAWRILLDYHWPGNVRELANVIKRSLLMANGDEINVAPFTDLPAAPRAETPSDSITVPLTGDLKIIERHIISEVIKRCQGNKAAAARLLGLHRKTLYRLLESSHPTPPAPQTGPQTAPLTVND